MTDQNKSALGLRGVFQPLLDEIDFAIRRRDAFL
jgi:hypothetical protein